MKESTREEHSAMTSSQGVREEHFSRQYLLGEKAVGVGSQRTPLRAAAREAVPSRRPPGCRYVEADVEPAPRELDGGRWSGGFSALGWGEGLQRDGIGHVCGGLRGLHRLRHAHWLSRSGDVHLEFFILVRGRLPRLILWTSWRS